MRISDWSSDVCSSDLRLEAEQTFLEGLRREVRSSGLESADEEERVSPQHPCRVRRRGLRSCEPAVEQRRGAAFAVEASYCIRDPEGMRPLLLVEGPPECRRVEELSAGHHPLRCVVLLCRFGEDERRAVGIALEQ